MRQLTLFLLLISSISFSQVKTISNKNTTVVVNLENTGLQILEYESGLKIPLIDDYVSAVIVMKNNEFGKVTKSQLTDLYNTPINAKNPYKSVRETTDVHGFPTFFEGSFTKDDSLYTYQSIHGVYTEDSLIALFLYIKTDSKEDLEKSTPEIAEIWERIIADKIQIKYK